MQQQTEYMMKKRGTGVPPVDASRCAFGNITEKTGSFTPRYTFSTKEYLPAAGLYLYQYRVYDSQAGRWTQRDPLDYSDTINLYAFCRNNPLLLTDADGLKPGDIFYTAEMAAYDACNYVYQNYSDNREYGGVISRTPDGRFVASEPTAGTESSWTPPRKQDNEVALYHTHGQDSKGKYDDEHFSIEHPTKPLEFHGDADVVVRRKTDLYLMTPSRTFQVMRYEATKRSYGPSAPFTYTSEALKMIEETAESNYQRRRTSHSRR